MPVPTNKVYINFSGAYVDVTQYVSSLSIDRGKSRELDRYTAGHANITLHNDSRIFDPFNTTSIYYPNVVPRKLVKIETNNVVVFTGYIDDWDFTYDISGKSFATVSVVDGFSILSAAEINGFITTSQLSSDRITVILNRPEVNWPVADRSIETGLTSLQADVIANNTNALQYLQLVETSENGQLFMNKSGQVTFKNHQTVSPISSSVVFADDSTVGAIKYTNIGVIYGSENLYNRVIVTRLGGTAQTAQATDSQTKYGVSAYSVDGVLLTDDLESSYLASYLVGLYDEPELRISEITVALHNQSTTDVNNLNALELSDVVQVKFTPNRIGSQINQYGVITGIKHRMGIDRHEITFNLGSVSSFPIVLDNAVYGRLGGSVETYDSSTITYDSPSVKYDGTEGFGYILGY